MLFGLSFLAALPTLLLHGLLAVYYAFNQLPIPTSAPTPQQAARTPVEGRSPAAASASLP